MPRRMELRAPAEIQTALDELFERVGRLAVTDTNRVYLLRYGYILLPELVKAGVVERLMGYTRRQTKEKHTIDFIYNSLVSIHVEFRADVINDLLKKFDSAWTDEIKTFAYEKGDNIDELYESLTNIADDRNFVAHFQNITVDEGDLRRKYDNVKSFIELLDSFLRSK